MAALEAEHASPPFSSPIAQTGPPSTSPGPLHISDLDPLTPSPQPRPHRLEPLQHDPAGRRRSTKKKRKTRKGREGEEGGGRRLESSGRGEEGSISETITQPDPLLGTSTFQQLQARLDPLYKATPPNQNGMFKREICRSLSKCSFSLLSLPPSPLTLSFSLSPSLPLPLSVDISNTSQTTGGGEEGRREEAGI